MDLVWWDPLHPGQGTAPPLVAHLWDCFWQGISCGHSPVNQLCLYHMQSCDERLQMQSQRWSSPSPLFLWAPLSLSRDSGQRVRFPLDIWTCKPSRALSLAVAR